MSRFRWLWDCCQTKSIGTSPAYRSYINARSLSNNSRFFKISEEVQQATAENRPIVALESTIYTHGFPYPDNLSLATHLESLVRINGGVPATIGILEGVARVGLEAEELIRLLIRLVSFDEHSEKLKISRRDLGFACGLVGIDGKSFNGGTTVAATMILASMAGIRVFATGGLGGVHRGVEETMDISADLTELGRTPVAVISSGCKSFLDIPKTLEYLETQGVPVATFADGRGGKIDFPAFYSRESCVRSPAVVRDEMDAARVAHAHFSLGLQSGLHFANPIPVHHEIPFQEMEKAIDCALREARASGVTGAANTPYILARLKEITGSKSIQSNRALIESNVVRGTRVAVALKMLEMSHATQTDRYREVSTRKHDCIVKATAGLRTQKASVSTPNRPFAASWPEIIIAGSLNVDVACDFRPKSMTEPQSPELHTSNPATITQSLGGVGHNVASAAHFIGANTRLFSAIGDDITGRAAREMIEASGMDTSGIFVFPSSSGSRTSQYVAINDKNKDLMLAMADVSILEQTGQDSILVQAFDEFWLPQLRRTKPRFMVIDANWAPSYLSRWLGEAKKIQAHVTFEPVSNTKSTRLFKLPKQQPLSVFPAPHVSLATPNAHEITAMHNAAREAGYFERQDWWEVIDALGIPDSGARTQLVMATNNELVDRGIPQQSIQLLPFIPSICTKLGSQGVLLTQLLSANDPRLTNANYAPYILSRCANGTEETLGVGGIYMRLFPALENIKAEDVVSVNGVGDTFAGTLVAGLAKRGSSARIEDLVDVAQQAAILTLKDSRSVSPSLDTLQNLL
ncbi:hypothetical protein M433DRAFT_112694 [Acidomyces richmondensis BFW]|nr:hypothetical protein M433DRAFT_112694 [Acidomyces richmondensis BFW]